MRERPSGHRALVMGVSDAATPAIPGEVRAVAAALPAATLLLGAEATWYTPWDVARDGRFIMARLVGSATEAGSGIVIVENWATEVRAKVKR